MGNKPIGSHRSASEDSFELTSTTLCLFQHPRVDRGVGSEANRTEFGSPFVFQPECPVTLKGIGVKSAPEGDSGPPFVFQSKCPVTLKGIGTDPGGPDRFGSEGSAPTSSMCWWALERDDPKGHPAGASRPASFAIYPMGVDVLSPSKWRRRVTRFHASRGV